ncbi:WD repeat domain phosphoinositide-interacting protein 3 [Hordeum vulgare]|nr:WD repeat domain phosphoinositide-interacting protein 3 [Hordeum vulgare]
MANEARAPRSEPQPIHKWETPEVGWVKINSDGAVSMAGTNGGGCTVLQDHQAAFVAGASSFFPGIVDPEAVETLACRKAIQMALDMNIQRVHLELDCKTLVAKINNPAMNLSAIGPWVQEIKTMVSLFLEFKVTWILDNLEIWLRIR